VQKVKVLRDHVLKQRGKFHVERPRHGAKLYDLTLIADGFGAHWLSGGGRR
jgi:hypothetical protein